MRPRTVATADDDSDEGRAFLDHQLATFGRVVEALDLSDYRKPDQQLDLFEDKKVDPFQNRS